jgi:hypothetical protein
MGVTMSLRTVRRLVWPRSAAGLALAGVLLAVVAVAADFLATRPLRLQAEAVQAQAVAAPHVAALPTARVSAATQLQQFHAAFPPLHEMAGALGSVDDVARRAGVDLRSGEYRIEQRADAAGSRLARYRVVLRTSGDYAQIRGFIGAALEQLHYVALDDVQFRRSGHDAAALEADVRLSLYLRR